MRVLLLILGATVLPLVWGWAVHWLLSRLWPEPGTQPSEPPSPTTPSAPFEYQI
jgi:hypothetical protein